MSGSSATPWTVVCQAPLSMGFPRQEYWSGLPFPSPGHLPDPGIKPASPALAGGFFTTEPTGKPKYTIIRKKSILRKKTVTKGNMGHLIMIEGSIQEENIYK